MKYSKNCINFKNSRQELNISCKEQLLHLSPVMRRPSNFNENNNCHDRFNIVTNGKNNNNNLQVRVVFFAFDQRKKPKEQSQVT